MKCNEDILRGAGFLRHWQALATVSPFTANGAVATNQRATGSWKKEGTSFDWKVTSGFNKHGHLRHLKHLTAPNQPTYLEVIFRIQGRDGNDVLIAPTASWKKWVQMLWEFPQGFSPFDGNGFNNWGEGPRPATKDLRIGCLDHGIMGWIPGEIHLRKPHSLMMHDWASMNHRRMTVSSTFAKARGYSSCSLTGCVWDYESYILDS